MWKRIPKEGAKQPDDGDYRAWQELLAEEADHRCVYCAIHERSFGGIRNFHVEHYRPKARFPELIDSFSNLFYACAICNTFKGNDWPDEPAPDLETPAYADPAEYDYSDLFDVNAGGLVSGTKVAATYMIERIYLNRPQLMLERREVRLRSELRVLVSQVLELVPQAQRANVHGIDDLQDAALQLVGRSFENIADAAEAVPYMSADVPRGG